MANTLTEIFPSGYVHIVGYSSTYAGSQGVADATSSGIVGTNISFINSVPLDTTVNITPGFNVYYKMQGFNPITQQYEDWHSMGAPLIDPPSGHALENIGIIGTWIDR